MNFSNRPILGSKEINRLRLFFKPMRTTPSTLLILALLFIAPVALAQSGVVYERAQNGATVSGSQQALKDAIMGGRKIALSLHAIKEYREVLPATVTGFDHVAGRSFMMTQLPAHAGAPGTGDTFNENTYNMSVVFLDDGRSFHHRTAVPGSSWSGPWGSSAAWNRYGDIRWVASGPARTVIANSNDPASMLNFAANYLAGNVADVVLRITIRNPSTGQPSLTWVVPATSIFYEPFRPGHPDYEGWLMTWPIANPAQAAWTIKIPALPIPAAGNPQNSSWANPSFMTIANAIVHSSGYLTFRGTWVPLSGAAPPANHINQVNWVSPGTLIEVLGEAQ